MLIYIPIYHIFFDPMGHKGELWTSVNYGQTFTYRTTYGNDQQFWLGGLAISSDGSKTIAAVKGLGMCTIGDVYESYDRTTIGYNIM